MPQEQEPVVNTETASTPVNESLVVEPTQPSVIEPEVKVESQSNPELEELKKKLNQAEMRANQLTNANKEAERKRLEEANDFKTLYEQAQADITAREERDEATKLASDAKKLRDSAIDSYPDERTRKAAKRYVELNDSAFYWGDTASTEVEAQAQVKAQLDVFAETFGTTEQSAPAATPVIVDANNPHEAMSSKTGEELDAMKARLSSITF